MNNKFLKKLPEMKGQTFQYAKQIHYVIDYKLDEENEKCTIVTHLSSYERKFEAMDEFLKFWTSTSNLPQLSAEKEPGNQIALAQEQGNSLAVELIGYLKDNIAKVQQDKNYIPQAQNINNNVNSIIHLAKLKWDMTKHLSKM